jgi:3-hydroxyisobutyrate dehydrogenase-like beta-hydroxyacid dehydrogenase
MVTGPQAIHEVYFGPNGVFQASAKKTIVDMSTTGPGTAQELGRAAEINDSKLIEAPVIGSVPAVNSGSLFIMAGAARVEDLDALRPVLERLGEVHYVGDLASAAALKLIANSYLGIVSTGAAELMAAGTAQRLDPETGVQRARAIVARSSAPRSWIPQARPRADHVRGARPSQGP